MLTPSRHMGHGRTGDYPIDGQPFASSAIHVFIQRRIDLRDYAAEKNPLYDRDCDAPRIGGGRTHVCEHIIPPADVLRMLDDVAEKGLPRSSATGPAFGFPMHSLPRPIAVSLQ